jgi:hypothetical protein
MQKSTVKEVPLEKNPLFNEFDGLIHNADGTRSFPNGAPVGGNNNALS